MATFVLIPGAGCTSWYWNLMADELRRRGHNALPVDLPCDDDAAGFEDYAAAVVDAAKGQPEPVLVGHSLGGFAAPLVCDRMPVRMLVLLTAMIPRPGEMADEWWANTGYPGVDGDSEALFYNDVSSELAAESEKHAREQSATPMTAPWPLLSWPDVPTRFLLCKDDRFFPAAFMRRVVRDRLGIAPDEMPGGHMVMLSRPAELADRLVSYLG